MPHFISPSVEPDVDAIFDRAGLGEFLTELSQVVVAARLPHGNPKHDDQAEEIVENVAKQVAEAPARVVEEVRLNAIRAVVGLHSQGFTYWTVDREALLDSLAELVPSDADLPTSTIAGLDGGLMQRLLRRECIQPDRHISTEAILATTKHVPGSRGWHQAARARDPRLPDYWFALDPEAALAACERLLARAELAELAELALGIERCLDLSRSESAGYAHVHVRPLTRLLARRRRQEGAADDALLTRSCWSYGRLESEQAPEVLGEDYGPLRELALAELGRMRAALRSDAAEQTLVERGNYLSAAMFFVLDTDPESLWPVLRRLLLAFRELRHRGVALDLRTWDEANLDAIPRPWSWLPDRISRALDLYLTRECQRDSELRDLRRELARFCLERLKTHERVAPDTHVDDAALVEPNAAWRKGYLYAVKELCASLGSRGLAPLLWSREHDPDPDVRELAGEVAEVLRRTRRLPEQTSPRRSVFAAFWWLRQAHVVALGEEPDPSGAQRTYRKEMRRQAQRA